MDYRGYKVKETTAIGAFDVPPQDACLGRTPKGQGRFLEGDTVSARVRLDYGAIFYKTKKEN